jgi:hypothetical protein
MILIRYLLIGLIGYLLVRMFLRMGKEEEPAIRPPEPRKNKIVPEKKISKKIGEYIEYEEINKKNH